METPRQATQVSLLVLPESAPLLLLFISQKVSASIGESAETNKWHIFCVEGKQWEAARCFSLESNTRLLGHDGAWSRLLIICSVIYIRLLWKGFCLKNKPFIKRCLCWNRNVLLFNCYILQNIKEAQVISGSSHSDWLMLQILGCFTRKQCLDTLFVGGTHVFPKKRGRNEGCLFYCIQMEMSINPPNPPLN